MSIQKHEVKAWIGFIWHTTEFNGGEHCDSVKSSVSSTVTDKRDVTVLHSQKPTVGVVCLCVHCACCCQWQ